MRRKPANSSLNPSKPSRFDRSPQQEKRSTSQNRPDQKLIPASRRKPQPPSHPFPRQDDHRPAGPPQIFLHRNQQGGIYVHQKDIETLFNFIDSNNYGRITMQDLKRKVSLFAKQMTNRDYKFLMAGKNEITIRELHDILKYNELQDFDPIAQAFTFFDPENTGFVDLNRLKEIFQLLGYEELTSGDLQILVECADADLDGKISLEDFRRLIPIYTPPENDPYTKNINIVSDPELHQQFVANLKEYGDTKRVQQDGLF